MKLAAPKQEPDVTATLFLDLTNRSRGLKTGHQQWCRIHCFVLSFTVSLLWQVGSMVGPHVTTLHLPFKGNSGHFGIVGELGVTPISECHPVPESFPVWMPHHLPMPFWSFLLFLMVACWQVQLNNYWDSKLWHIPLLLSLLCCAVLPYTMNACHNMGRRMKMVVN